MMDFLSLPVDLAVGAVLTHSLGSGDGMVKKGTILTEPIVEKLRLQGFSTVPAARLAADDVPENVAAARLAQRIAGIGVEQRPAFTGRVNLYAREAGLVCLQADVVTRFNEFDESITVATLPEYSSVSAGEMVATIKIIPFAVPEKLVGTVEKAIHAAVNVQSFKPKRVALISTLLPHLKNSTINKTRRVLDARLAPSGSVVVQDIRVPHQASALAAVFQNIDVTAADIVIVFGASAVTDRRDVVPAGIVAAGGTLSHLGMPVDPGNLLVLAQWRGIPVIGAPGCARSPRENGFDWVLNRLLCDIPVRRADIMRMGVGGLLKEIDTRPQPRAHES